MFQTFVNLKKKYVHKDQKSKIRNFHLQKPFFIFFVFCTLKTWFFFQRLHSSKINVKIYTEKKNQTKLDNIWLFISNN